MTGTAEPTSPHTAVPTPSRLYQTAAWAVIVAGTVFVVAVIFFAGAYLDNGGWPGERHHHGPCMMQMGPPRPPQPSPPVPGPDGPGGLHRMSPPP